MTSPRTVIPGRATGWISVAFLLVLVGAVWFGVRIVEAAPGTDVSYTTAHSAPASSHGTRHPTATPAPAPREVFVPDLTGYTVAGARAALKLLGLQAGQVSTHADSAAAGTVDATTPRAGVTVAVGTHVALAVSSGVSPSPGPALVAVPNVVGMTQTDATKTLTGLGLKVTTLQGPGAAGEVIKQSPEPGTNVDPAGAGVSVTIVVGTG